MNIQERVQNALACITRPLFSSSQSLRSRRSLPSFSDEVSEGPRGHVAEPAKGRAAGGRSATTLPLVPLGRLEHPLRGKAGSSPRFLGLGTAVTESRPTARGSSASSRPHGTGRQPHGSHVCHKASAWILRCCGLRGFSAD